MPYTLGLGLGTSRVVAAITPAASGSAGPEVVALDVHAPDLPTVQHLSDDGTMVVGSAAATTYAAQCHPVAGDTLAVYHLGATFSASIDRRSGPHAGPR